MWLPVNEIQSTSFEEHKYLEISSVFFRSDGITLNTPVGTPASIAVCDNAKADKGVSSAGFTTTVQPEATAKDIHCNSKIRIQ